MLWPRFPVGLKHLPIKSLRIKNFDYFYLNASISSDCMECMECVSHRIYVFNLS
ncbi:hypothetical protein MBLL_00762 (plasmid) [Methylobacterium bullatum]|uniref:Uncharacterized protein n=1 Tax=Methylobacterium bullatum TaxID=570505 RepID=A0A679JXW0_9HYPH|nr:hypothetical protein MBLL_00762 [Methylobacterium bullatum]